MSRSILLSSVRYMYYVFILFSYIRNNTAWILTRASGGGDRSPVGTTAVEPCAAPEAERTGPARRRHKSSSLLTHNRLSSAASSRRSLFLCSLFPPRPPPLSVYPFPLYPTIPVYRRWPHDFLVFGKHTHTHIHVLEYVQGLQVPTLICVCVREHIADGCTKMSSPSK